MKVLVIIVTYNGLHWMDNCLGSLQNSSIPLDIFVIDNLSTDGTADHIENKFPSVELIRSKENLGFAAGNNIGLQKTIDEHYDYAFLLNQDAWLHSPDVIQKLIQISKNNPDYGIISPIHLNGNGDKLDWNFRAYISRPENDCRNLYSDLLLKKELQDLYEVSFVNAAAWLISSKCLKAVGLFESKFFPHYGADGNYIFRVRYNKIKVAINPETLIHHDREDRQGKKLVNQFSVPEEILGFKSRALNPFFQNAETVLTKEIKNHRKLSLKLFLKFNITKAKVHYNLYKSKKALIHSLLLQREKYL